MKAKTVTSKKSNSKGAAIFKKMLEDKGAIRQHLKKGGKIADLKEALNRGLEQSRKGQGTPHAAVMKEARARLK